MSDVFDSDPGRRNLFFNAETPAQYLADYSRKLSTVVELIDADAMNRFVDILRSGAEAKATIFVAGNGGSAAIADHLCCDFTKGTHRAPHAPLRAFSLTSNVAIYTAMANDFGFEHAFSASLALYADKKDILIAISSSGNSPNIVAAVQKAKQMGVLTVGLTGFDGGEVKRLADISLHVPFQNYGLVEDCHQMIMHSAAQFIAVRREQSAGPHTELTI